MTLKRIISTIGTVLALGCIGWLIWRQAPSLPPLDLSAPALWAGLIVAWFTYVLSQCAAAESWRSILTLAGNRTAPRLAWGQPMVSQIGKYIPGNVVHLVGRVALGRRDGVPTTILAAGMVLEVGITLGVGLSVVGLLFLIRPDVVATLTAELPDMGARLLPVAVAVILGIGLALGTMLLRARLRALEVPRPRLAQLARPLGLHLISFAILGVSLWATALAVDPATAPGLLLSTLIFTFAWAVGFVMPGAPGGIGVRDSVIVLGLAVTMGSGPALAVALLHRAVSIAGDLATFAIGWHLRRSAAQRGPRNRPDPAIIAAD